VFNNNAVKVILEAFYPRSAIRLMESNATRFHALQSGERFYDASAVLRRIGAAVDKWPIPPAGLFVVEERTVYLRSTSAMTVVHEAAHALDCALGGGVYLSGTDHRISQAFKRATQFVTPYAGCGQKDEYFAECVRAFLGANDPGCHWPKATRERLERIDATMAQIIRDLFAEIEARHGERSGEQLTLKLEAA
jgi:hypothetical protein